MHSAISSPASHRPLRNSPVVCVGGSAGGLDAYIRLLKCLPAELIADRLLIEPNRVYIIPENRDLHVEGGEFHLKPISKPRGWPDVITVFLRSLTACWDGKLIAVIVSGYDGDGAAALCGIKEVGGITLAQKQSTAAQPDMPQSAIDTGCIDWGLSPEDIALEIRRIACGTGSAVATSTISGVVNPAANTLAKPTAGTPVMLVVLTDVSHRKLMEAAMRASEERYRALVEWSPVAMLVHRGGQVVFSNPAALKMLGARTAAELDGKPLLDRIHPASHATVLAATKPLADPGGAAPLAALRCIRLDGTLIDVQAQSTATSYEGELATITCWHAAGAGRQ